VKFVHSCLGDDEVLADTWEKTLGRRPGKLLSHSALFLSMSATFLLLTMAPESVSLAEVSDGTLCDSARCRPHCYVICFNEPGGILIMNAGDSD
jgi:hypothetical protein